LPFWPLGLASFSDEYVSLGLKCGKKQYVAVWRTKEEGEDSVVLKLDLADSVCIRCGYPGNMPVKYQRLDDGLEVFLEAKTARIFEIEENDL